MLQGLPCHSMLLLRLRGGLRVLRRMLLLVGPILGNELHECAMGDGIVLISDRKRAGAISEDGAVISKGTAARH
jgi:hypothetical protein